MCWWSCISRLISQEWQRTHYWHLSKYKTLVIDYRGAALTTRCERYWGRRRRKGVCFRRALGSRIISWRIVSSSIPKSSWAYEGQVWAKEPNGHKPRLCFCLNNILVALRLVQCSSILFLTAAQASNTVGCSSSGAFVNVARVGRQWPCQGQPLQTYPRALSKWSQ